jgi:type I restriction enzyme S subunit
MDCTQRRSSTKNEAIHLSTLKEKMVAYPEEKGGEQQKIADYLSSLDTLITAETEKLDALKTHKKGLMQQLFPVVENEIGS